MSVVWEFLNGVVKTFTIIVQKIITVILIIFFLGVLFGYFIVPIKGLSALAVLAFVILVVFYQLDEGILFLTLYFLWVFFT